MLFGHFHTDYAPPNGLNTMFYSNAEVDGLLESARAEFDKEKRFALYIQAQQTAMADAPYRWPASAVAPTSRSSGSMASRSTR